MNGSARKAGGRRVLFASLILVAAGSAGVPWLLPPPAGLDLFLSDGTFGADLTPKTARVGDASLGSPQAFPIVETTEGARVRIERIESGERKFSVLVPGYRRETVDVVAAPLQRHRSEVVLEPTFGRLQISAYDARTSQEPVATALSVEVADQSLTGRRQILFSEIPPGTYEVAASAPGFCGVEQETTVRERETTDLGIYLSPQLEGNERARIMLDWGKDPRDLDAHVLLSNSSVPLASNHVFFGRKSGLLRRSDAIYAQLDVDWLQSEGVETITITDRALGVYQYFVHHYAGDKTLGASGAKVEVRTGDCKRQTYSVPPDCGDKWWYVFDLKVTPDETLSVERNECQPRQPFPWDQRK